MNMETVFVQMVTSCRFECVNTSSFTKIQIFNQNVRRNLSLERARWYLYENAIIFKGNV